MTNVYQRLANYLDNLPAGFPLTEIGVELQILKRLFSQQEAEIAPGLVLQPGNAQKPINICLCCGCCCQILKNLKILDGA